MKEEAHFVFHFMSCLHSQLPPCCTVVFVLQIRFTSNLKFGKCKVDIEVDNLTCQETTSDTHLSPGRLCSSQSLPHGLPCLTSRAHIFQNVSPVLQSKDMFRDGNWGQSVIRYLLLFVCLLREVHSIHWLRELH